MICRMQWLLAHRISQLFVLLALLTTFSSSASAQGAVTQLVLINADTDQDVGPLTDGMTINLTALGTNNINVRADVSGSPGSVVFGLDGNNSFRKESGAPYALAGDLTGDYLPLNLDPGPHTVSATPYSEANGKGTKGTTVTINFTITSSELTLNPQSHNFGGVQLGSNETLNVTLKNNASAGGSGVFQEDNGVVVFEIESQSPVPSWEQKTTIPGFTGSSYFEWVGADQFSKPGVGELTYRFQIQTAGQYELRVRSRIAAGTSSADHNDSWFRFPTGQNVSGEAALNGNWFKMYCSQKNIWSWQTNTVDHDPHPIRVFLTAGTHELKVSGRSKNHAIDRVVIYRYLERSFNDSTFTNFPQSQIGGGGSAYTISSISVAGTNAGDFSFTAPGTPFQLSAGQMASLSVRFAPQGTGERFGSLRVFSNAPTSPEVLLLEGTGESGSGEVLDVSPASHDFGTVTVGQSSPQPLVVELSNDGSSSITINGLSFSGANAGDFATSKGTPFSIPAGQSTTLNVSFTPSAAGGRIGQLDISSLVGSYSVGLSGTGQSPSGVQQVVSISVIDPVTDQQVSLLQNGGTINLSALPSGFNLRANTSPETVGSVRFQVSGTETLKVTENVGPYAIFGDTEGDFNGGTLAEGSYTLVVTPYSEPKAKGTVGVPLEVNFTVGTGEQPSLDVSPLEFDFGSSPVGEESGAVLQLELENSGSTAVEVSSLSFSGAAAGDFAVDTSVPLTIPAGQSVLVPVSFTPSAAGERSATLSVFSNASGSPDVVALSGFGETAGPAVVRLVLINAETNEEIGEITEGAVINTAAIGTDQLNVRADTVPALVPSVRFDLNGSKARVENAAPYALFGDIEGVFTPGTFAPGSYTLKATPYELTGAKGTAGAALIRNFEITDTP